jgi:hypothetical protein
MLWTIAQVIRRGVRRHPDVRPVAPWPCGHVVKFLASTLLVLGSLGILQSCGEARAVAIESAGRFEQVRLGFGLDLEGRVDSGCTAGKFALRDPIHYSMKITGAAPGGIVRASVHDVVSRRIVWSEDRPVVAGASFVTFEIGRGLAAGRYVAESSLGATSSPPSKFLVHVWGRNLDDFGRVSPHG